MATVLDNQHLWNPARQVREQDLYVSAAGERGAWKVRRLRERPRLPEGAEALASDCHATCVAYANLVHPGSSP